MKRLAFLVLFLAATSGVALAQWAAVLGASRAASGPVTATDNFNRANQDPMAGAGLTMSDGVSVWVNGPGSTLTKMAIDTNVLTSTGSPASVVVSSPSFAANQKSTITFGSGAAVTFCGPTVHANTSNGNCYVALVDDTTHIIIYKLTDSGSIGYTSLATVVLGAALVVGDTLGLGINGTTLTVYVNGSAQGTTASDSSYTTGQPGIYVATNGKHFSLFTATEL